MNFAALDLNLLRVFSAMMVELSTVRAGDRVGLSQPAVSAAIRRLRQVTGDDLFVRQGNHMVPTPRALELMAPVQDALRQIEEAFNQTVRFDPAKATERFFIAGSDYVSTFLMPRIVEATERQAPDVVIQMLDFPPSSLFARLSEGRVDLGIERLLEPPEWIRQVHLHRSFAVCVARKGHPLLEAHGVKPGSRLPPELYCAIPAVILSTDGTRSGSFGPPLKKLGLERQVKITVPHFHAIAEITARSDVLGSLPIHLARHLAEPFGLNLFLPPFDPPHTQMYVYWDRRRDNDPAHRWLRDLIAEVLDLEKDYAEALAQLTATSGGNC